jgi:hypothetical protein
MELSVDAFGGEEVLAPGLGGPSRGHHTTEHVFSVTF